MGVYIMHSCTFLGLPSNLPFFIAAALIHLPFLPHGTSSITHNTACFGSDWLYWWISAVHYFNEVAIIKKKMCHWHSSNPRMPWGCPVRSCWSCCGWIKLSLFCREKPFWQVNVHYHMSAVHHDEFWHHTTLTVLRKEEGGRDISNNSFTGWILFSFLNFPNQRSEQAERPVTGNTDSILYDI